MDLLSLDDDVSTSGSGAVGVTAEEGDSVKSWFHAASIAATGQRVVLYQNSTLAVSIISEYRAHQGRLQLFVYNKSHYDFARFEVNIHCKEDGLTARTQGCPVLVTAGDEARVMIAVESLAPFNESPALDIAFSMSGVNYKYALKLPVTISCFFEALPSDKNTYMQRWKSLDGEVQEVFTAGRPIGPELLGHLRSVLVPGLHIGLAAELDTSDKTVTGSVSFKTGTPVSGGPEGMSLFFHAELVCCLLSMANLYRRPCVHWWHVPIGGGPCSEQIPHHGSC
jgi:hypothetical protein